MSTVKLSKTSYGSLWFGGHTFPGFFFKKNLGCGGRRSTNFAAGGNSSTNTPQYIYNKYKPGQSGIGASSISNRRAKNRLATICGPEPCPPCFMTIGQYSPYTHNPNGVYNCK